MKYLNYITGLTLIAALAACSSDDDIANPTAGGNLISFKTTLNTTRSPRIDAITSLDSLRLTGWQYADGTYFKNVTPESFFYDAHVAVASDGTATTKYSWPNNGNRLSFFAYGPSDIQKQGLTPTTAQRNAGPASFQYVVPADLANQRDLIVGSVHNISANGSGSVAMTLKHALTAVQIVIGPDSKAVTWDKIEVQNVQNRGTFVMDTTTSTTNINWTGLSGSATYTLTPNVTEGTQGYVFCGNETSLLLLPQTLSAQTRIAVTFTDNGTPHTEYVTPTNLTWEAGKIVTYQLSVTSLYELRLKSTIADWTAGDTKDITAETPIQE